MAELRRAVWAAFEGRVGLGIPLLEGVDWGIDLFISDYWYIIPLMLINIPHSLLLSFAGAINGTTSLSETRLTMTLAEARAALAAMKPRVEIFMEMCGC